MRITVPAPPRAALAALTAVVAVTLLSAVRSAWTIDPDASLYVSLARSIAADGTYQVGGVVHAKYPPGLPLLLAGVVRLAGPEAYAAMHAVLVACLLWAVVASHALARRLGLSSSAALAVAMAVGVSQTLFELSIVYLRTEVPFLACTLFAILAGWRALDGRSSPAWVVAAGLLSIAAVSLRLSGVALAAPFALALLRPGASRTTRARAAILAGCVLLAVIGWRIHATRAAQTSPEPVNYASEFLAVEPRDLSKIIRVDNPPVTAGDLFDRVVRNTEVLARSTAVLVSNVDRASSRLPVGLLLLGTVLLGFHRMFWNRDPRPHSREAAAYALAMIVVHLLWPFDQQERFYVPILPFMLIGAGTGVRALADAASRLAASDAGRRSVTLASVALFLVLAAQRSDHPTILGRWSASYAALLLGTAGTTVILVRLMYSGWRGGVAPILTWVVPVLMVIPFAAKRWVEWPAQCADFDTRRLAAPASGALGSIDVDPRLESVARWIAANTTPEDVIMTDVPVMLEIMSGRRCVPFVYRLSPPSVLDDGVDYIFYSREIEEAANVMDLESQRFDVAAVIAGRNGTDHTPSPTIYATRRR